MCIRLTNNIPTLWVVVAMLLLLQGRAGAQDLDSDKNWIRPVDGRSPAVWGIRDGIVFGLWPYGIEPAGGEIGGGPRGLIRVGYEFMGEIYHINFIAIEPVVNGKMEFSEISPSKVDGKWGKLMWADDEEGGGRFYPSAISRGTISHPDPENPDVEQLSLYVFIEQFVNGAHPYLKISIRNDRPEEIGLEIFNHENGATMERCALTATMGNYSRLRLLYLKDTIMDSRELYQGYDDIAFIEKEGYPVEQMLRDGNEDLIVLATGNEPFAELSSWPQVQRYFERRSWRYRPFFKLTQYWRKESARYDPSLHVRVNGRAKYWSGGSQDNSNYVNIPGGPSFENFELRKNTTRGKNSIMGSHEKHLN